MRRRSNRTRMKSGLWITVVAVLGLYAIAAAPGATVLSAHHKRPESSTQTTKKKSHHRHYRHREVGQKAPTPDRVKEIQSALSHEGFYQGEPNGKMDANTVTALQKFQSAHGLDPSGKLDAPTLQKMGLGSDVAGVSAPKPATPPSCCSTSSSGPSSATLTATGHSSCCSAGTATAALPEAAANATATDPKPRVSDAAVSAHSSSTSGNGSSQPAPH
ncbi:MAG TPA: peptidoglycan-binding domain-containing protein [Candidatus Acidoferrum sp.]|nr:peptidoglycan-binding domain-containing protein [Candidatus Acidoferrum sp.]